MIFMGKYRYLKRRQIDGRKIPENEARQEVHMQLKDISAHVSRKQYEHVQYMLTIVNLYQVIDHLSVNVAFH